MRAIEQIEDDIIEYAKHDVEDAFMMVTGLFVGLATHYTNVRGEDGDGQKTITITGPGGQRVIRIYAEGYDHED